VPFVPRRYRHVEYWTLPLRVKLAILVFLTDEVLQSSIVRSELDTRLEVERMGVDEESESDGEPDAQNQTEQQEQQEAEQTSEERHQQQQQQPVEEAKPTAAERPRPKSAGVVSEGNKALMRQGARVEVLAIDPGLRGCWFTASVVTAVGNKVRSIPTWPPLASHRRAGSLDRLMWKGHPLLCSTRSAETVRGRCGAIQANLKTAIVWHCMKEE
jgi:hypothetical protein